MKLVYTFWLLLFNSILALAAPNSESPLAPPIFGYDEREQASIAYDRSLTSGFDYDSISAFLADEKENRTDETDGLVARFVESIAAKTAPRVLTEAEKALYGRVTHPKGFRQQVWERAKAPDGNVYDPNGRILKYDEPWELGHRPAHKFSDAQTRAAQEGWDRQTWIRYQNDPDIYRPELPSSNASHRWE